MTDLPPRHRPAYRAVADYSIEGEPVTHAQIGQRLGVSVSAARKRFLRERRKPGPVTWAGLARC